MVVNLTKIKQYYAYKFICNNSISLSKLEQIIGFAEKIEKVFGISFTNLGYILLHPDKECSDIGISFKYDENGKKKFMKLDIPERMVGKHGDVSTPVIYFSIKSEVNRFDEFSLEIKYPIFEHCAFSIEIYCAYKLLRRPPTYSDFREIVDFISDLNVQIETGFMHIYKGNWKRLFMNGGITGLYTFEELRQAKVMIPMHDKWRGVVPDVFLFNIIKRSIMDNELTDEITNVVGNENVLINDNYVLFSLPQDEFLYRFNRYFPSKAKRQIRNILRKKGKLQLT